MVKSVRIVMACMFQLNLPDEVLLNELHEVQDEMGFGNPQL